MSFRSEIPGRELFFQEMHQMPSDLKQLRLGFFGNMLGRNPGFVSTQAQIVADLFAAEGAQVTSASSKKNRLWRLLDIAASIIANRNRIDICVLEVYSGLYMILAEVATRLCKLFGLKLIGVLHGGRLPDFAQRYPRWTRSVLARADILVAPSPFLCREMGNGEFDLRVIPNVVDLANYEFKPRKKIAPKLIWMRSFHSIYNPLMALRVFAELLKRFPEARLVMAGVDKGLEAEARELAGDLGIAHRVTFPGFLAGEVKSRAFAEADIFINTNRIDNMPVAIIEACAAGLPVVATNVGGIPHLLTDGHEALLVPSDNAEEMAEAIERLLRDPDLTERLSTNGRTLAEMSSWPTVKREWLALFDELADERTAEPTVAASSTSF